MPTDARAPQDMGAQPEHPVPEPDPGEEIDVMGGFVRWATRATVAGATLSILIHLVLLLIAGVLTVRFQSADAGGDGPPDRVEFAVLTESELAALLAPDQSTDQPIVPERDASTDPATAELIDASSTAADSLFEAALEIEIDTGAGDIGEGEGDALLTGAGGGGTSFFGLEAQGSRFAFIVDRSGSMRGENMARLRTELVNSISELPETGEYLIVFFSDTADPLGGSPRWFHATESSKAEARRLIATVEAGGGTKPIPAFEMVFGRRVKPDAIYFMTDGIFSEDVPSRIAGLNRRFRIPIHCILFGDPSPNSIITNEVRAMMRTIANQSGGRFQHIGVGP